MKTKEEMIIDTDIEILQESIAKHEEIIDTYKAKLKVLKDRKKSILNYLNSDND